MNTQTSTTPTIVSRESWYEARRALLMQEKQLTKQRDQLAAERRRLPMVKVDTAYTFDGPDGTTTLRELFGEHPQLVVCHFMFDPDWDEGCRSCSYFADNFTGALAHLPVRHTAFAVISRAPLTKLIAYQSRMGWTFPWYSSYHSTFNHDYGVTIDTVSGDEYNYRPAAELLVEGKIWVDKGELPGLSVFWRDGEQVYHTYSTYQRGLPLPQCAGGARTISRRLRRVSATDHGGLSRWSR